MPTQDNTAQVDIRSQLSTAFRDQAETPTAATLQRAAQDVLQEIARYSQDTCGRKLAVQLDQNGGPVVTLLDPSCTAQHAHTVSIAPVYSVLASNGLKGLRLYSVRIQGAGYFEHRTAYSIAEMERLAVSAVVALCRLLNQL